MTSSMTSQHNLERFYKPDRSGRPNVTLRREYATLRQVQRAWGVSLERVALLLEELGLPIYIVQKGTREVQLTLRGALKEVVKEQEENSDFTLEELFRRTTLPTQADVKAALTWFGEKSRYGTVSEGAALSVLERHFQPEALEFKGETVYTLPDAGLLLGRGESALVVPGATGELETELIDSLSSSKRVVRQYTLEGYARDQWGLETFPWSEPQSALATQESPATVPLSPTLSPPLEGNGPSMSYPSSGGNKGSRTSWRVFTAILVTGLAGTGQADGLLSRLESTPVPYAEFLDGHREWSVPFVTLERSEQLAGVMQYEWQRFQDRLHWHIVQSVNRSLLPIAIGAPPHDLSSLNCVTEVAADLSISIAQGLSGQGWLEDKAARAALTIPPGSAQYVPQGLSYAVADDRVKLTPNPFPRVQRSNYCPDTPTEYFPDNADFYTGLGVYVPNFETCLAGACVRGSSFPKPFLIHRDKLKSRMLEACNSRVKTYWDEYQKSVLRAVKKTLPRALSWDGFYSWHGRSSGVVLAPVAGKVSNRKAVQEIAQKVRDPLLRPYLEQFNKNLEKGFVTPSSYGRDSPGLSPLEEVKRWLLGGTIREMEASGYANMFQSWRSLDTVLDPRPLVYWATYTHCDLTPQGPVCSTPAVPVDLPDLLVSSSGCSARADRGAGTTTFTLPRFHFGWVSVPEGHTVPRIQGTARGGPL